MPNGFEAHASEETLERYAMGTLGEAELPSFEEHLLVCSICQDRLEETEAFVRATREAARNIRASPSAGLLAKLDLPTRIWTPALAVLAVVLGALGWWNLWRETSPPAVAVALQSVRGPEGLAGALAPRGHPLRVRLDLNGVSAPDGCELEVVNSQGRAVQRTSLRCASGAPEVSLAKLETGQYWVRLYSPRPQRELLREFGLRVE